MKKFSAIALISSFIMVIPLVSLAETVVRTGESVSIGNDQVVENDFYAAGQSVVHSGEIKGDMYAAGASVTVNGPIGADLTILGGTAQVHSEIKDDVRVIAGDTVIGGKVVGDVFVIGGVLKVLSSASIDGDLFFYGGEAEISGPVKGSVMGTAEAFRIDAQVEGSVDVIASRTLVLGDRASVSGNVSYQSVAEINRAQQAVVVGEVVRNSATSENNDRDLNIIPLFVITFAVLCLFLFFKDSLTRLFDDIFTLPARATLIGLGTLFGGIPAAFLMILTVLGSLIGIFMLFGLIAWFILTLPITVIFIGSLIMRLSVKDKTLSLLVIVVGLIALVVLLLIPIIGPMLLLGAFVVTLGGLGYQGYRVLFAR